jgi:dimethylamine/trimethylamine dehydrogenase
MTFNDAYDLTSQVLVAYSPSPQAGVIGLPTQARGMDKTDIKEFRRWHRNAALRAKVGVEYVVMSVVGHKATKSEPASFFRLEIPKPA